MYLFLYVLPPAKCSLKTMSTFHRANSCSALVSIFFFYMLIYFKINEKSNRNVTLQGKYEVAFLPPSSSQIELSLQIFIILNNKYF